jgi:hypothetical protein
VKYLACLVNLEGQFDKLLPEAPPPAPKTKLPTKNLTQAVNLAERDHAKMGTAGKPMTTAALGKTPYAPKSTWTATDEQHGGVADVYTEMARPFTEAVVSGFVAGQIVAFDPTLRFPVLLHWSFTSFGSLTFKALVQGLDSGLLGTSNGEQALEVVETGHTGLDHRTRRGDQVRSWYRGPFVPHPTPTDRLALAHAADQLRIVVPDGREDISLAAAFEIGRLLALARPSMIAALMRWRQTGYQTARRESVWGELSGFLGDLLGEYTLDARIGVHLGRGLAEAITVKPEEFLGDPRPLASPGRQLQLDASPEVVMAQGFGLPVEAFKGTPEQVLTKLRAADVVLAREPGLSRETLSNALNQVVDRMIMDVRHER